LTLGDLARAPNSLRIRLDGLSVADVGRFVGQTLGQAAPVSLVSALHRETEGNPFFVTEIVRLLAANGQIARLPTGSATLAVPSTVRDAIQRRTAQLSPPCNEMLMAAAVIGREFDINTLTQTWNPQPDAPAAPPPRSVLDLLDEARAAHIIEAGAAPLGTYRFVHALIRETLYDALPTADRVRFHQRAGESLEQAAGAGLSELAHHFSQAAAGGDVRKGAAYSIRAAEFAADRLAYEEAALHYERAIQFSHLDAELGRRRAALQLELGHNQWRSGEFARARATFQAAASTARADGEAEQLARAALGYGGGFRGFTLGTVDPVLIDLLDEALAALPQHDSALRAQVTARQALALYDTPNSLARRDALSQAAVAMAKRSGDADSHLGALCCRHWATWGPDNLEDRIVVATEMIALAERVGDHEMALQAHRFRLVDALEIGDVDQVSADVAACESLAERLRQPYYTWYVLAFRALRAFLDGRFEDSERCSQEALAVGQRAQNRNVSQMYGAQMLALRREQGRIGEVEPMLQGLVAQFPTVPAWRCGLAYVLNELDRRDDARTQFEILAADDFSGIPCDAFWLVAMQGTIDVCVSLADRKRAAVLYRLVRPYARHYGVNVVGTCASSVARGLGCLAGLLHDTETAHQHFESAMAMETRLGARPLLAHTQHDYGVMLLRPDGKGDRDKARQLLLAAHHTYEELGMHTFAQRAGRLLAHSRRQPKSPLRTRPRLTALRRP
jgi:tetratricopeptide (TPR) repeat protein